MNFLGKKKKKTKTRPPEIPRDHQTHQAAKSSAETKARTGCSAKKNDKGKIQNFFKKKAYF